MSTGWIFLGIFAGTLLLVFVGFSVAHNFGYRSAADKEIEACHQYENLTFDKLPAKCRAYYE